MVLKKGPRIWTFSGHYYNGRLSESKGLMFDIDTNIVHIYYQW